jgi:capsular exopolysaccharide synthesis family protein
VSILGDKNAPAAVPETETGTTLRYAMILFSSIAALFLPAIAVILWDLRKGRVNSAADVSKRLKIPVTGTLPMIPAMVMRRLGTPTRRSQIWRMRYTEAIDGVAARLIRNAENDQSRVTLVTSALSGEGKTWLATQLALSLANARRRTLLVDFDLRQPALDEALGLPLSPGVCEALRGQGDVAQMVQTTETENLFVLTAGSWNRRVLAALSDGSVVTLLEQLRADFEFVIIDSSPLLPVVDARLVCQHVDAVILSVLRDVSQSAKVVAAQEMLDAFGVRNLTAVVTGGEQYGSAKAMLQQAALAEEEQFQANEPLTPAEATQQGSSDARHTLLAEEAPPRTEAGEDDAAGHKN